MNVRYCGESDAQLVPLPDGDTVEVPRMEWVDLPAELARGLAHRDDWELEASKKAAKSRAANAADTEEQ